MQQINFLQSKECKSNFTLGSYEKKIFVDKIFKDAAIKYDLMNDLMSFFSHRLWKNHLINMSQQFFQKTTLDLASGTLDLTVRGLKKATKTHFVCCDPNQKMLSLGMSKLSKADHNSVTAILCAAEKLPFENNFFDCIVTGFGPRNFSDLSAAINESLRVLKPGGKFISLELFSPNKKFESWFFKIAGISYIRLLSVALQRNDIYEYLIDSILTFSEINFLQLADSCGFVLEKRIKFLPFPAIIHQFSKHHQH